MRVYISSVGRFRMLGGDRAVDVVNSSHWHGDQQVDFIPDYPSLVKWCVPALLLNEQEAAVLLGLSSQEPAIAASVHLKWTELRSALQGWLAQTTGRDKLIATLDTVVEALRPGELFAMNLERARPQQISLPLLRSAMAIVMLVLFPPAGSIRSCESCGGYFIDQSRAKPRRWCSMDTCGNRAKARRHRQKGHLP